MAIGYLIGINKMPLKQALKKAIKNEMEIIPHFMKQLEVYDLEKMAFVSIQREWFDYFRFNLRLLDSEFLIFISVV